MFVSRFISCFLINRKKTLTWNNFTNSNTQRTQDKLWSLRFAEYNFYLILSQTNSICWFVFRVSSLPFFCPKIFLLFTYRFWLQWQEFLSKMNGTENLQWKFSVNHNSSCKIFMDFLLVFVCVRKIERTCIKIHYTNGNRNCSTPYRFSLSQKIEMSNGRQKYTQTNENTYALFTLIWFIHFL